MLSSRATRIIEEDDDTHLDEENKSPDPRREEEARDIYYLLHTNAYLQRISLALSSILSSFFLRSELFFSLFLHRLLLPFRGMGDRICSGKFNTLAS